MGKLLIILALVSTGVSAWSYYTRLNPADRPKGKRKKKANQPKPPLDIARYGFYFMSVFVTLASFYLLYLIFDHQFQYSYVYRYSAKNLSFGLLLSTFWAGQEGSFLLWAWFIAIMGLIFIKTARKYENHAMFYLNLAQAFFLLLLVKVSPFAEQAHAPLDGRGLNPLLENFWMIIHPPLLFLGYAAATMPLALALAAMTKRDYGDWVRQALPWSLFTSVTLGGGIILGAFWAYGTLGWGGYWGWDPVENSSLIPWLVNFALFHGLIVEKMRGALRRTNLALAVISFVLVIYATFLTRSGVLADFSVHSFQDLGINAYLIMFMLGTLGFGLGILFSRFREIKAQPINLSELNRENVLLISMVVLLGSGLVTILGTSFPLISRLFTQPSNVNISFYNQVNLPFAIAMTVLLGIAPVLKWGASNRELLKRLSISLVLTALSAVFAFLQGVRDGVILLFMTTTAFAFFSNGQVLLQQLRFNWRMTGASLTHVGVALMFLGIIVSGNFDEEQHVVLTQGEQTTVLGKQLLLEGLSPKENGKDELNIRVVSEESEYVANPRHYYSEYNKGMMREPFIDYGWVQDFYISPIETRTGDQHDEHVQLYLKKGEKKQLDGFEILFTSFEMHSHAENGVMQVGAKLEIAQGEQKFAVTPALMMSGNQRKAVPAEFPVSAGNYSSKPSVSLVGINANEKSVQLDFHGLGNPANGDAVPVKMQASINVSKKPFMNVLWLGTILISLGTVISIKRRSSEPA
ncbi:MAG: heme lyase CcmF/NrfE family subunit [bacterium]